LSPSSEGGVGREILEEGCYYLSRLGLSDEKIARHFETAPQQVAELVRSYSSKLKSGKVTTGDLDRTFWEGVKREAEGDLKLTVVSDKGFHHVWRSELQKLDGHTLMAVFESSRDFLDSDPNQKFLDYPAPKGYDPLALDREVSQSVGVVTEILEGKWRESKTGEERRAKRGIQT
jgi:hypothetical protein